MTTRSLAGCLALVLGAAALGSAPPAQAGKIKPSCSIFWTGAANTSWADSMNWSLTDGGASAGRTPQASDFVCMSSAPTTSTVILPQLHATVGGIDFAATSAATPSLICGAGLTIDSSPSTINNLSTATNASDCELDGSARLTLTGATAIDESLTIAGPPLMTLAPGATISAGGRLYFRGGTDFRNDGTVNAAYGITLDSGSDVDNAGTINLTGSTIGGDHPRSHHVWNEAGAAITTSYYYSGIYALVRNDGQIAVSSGTFTLALGATGDGGYALSQGADMIITGGQFRLADGHITGLGTLLVAGGVISGSATVRSVEVDAQISASRHGSPTFENGTLTVPEGGGMYIAGGLTMNDFHVVNYGAMTVNNYIGDNTLAAGSSFDNYGALSFGYAGRHHLVSDGSAGVGLTNEAGATIDSSSKRFEITIPVTNAGTLTADEGMLIVDTLTNLVDGTLTDGTYQAIGMGVYSAELVLPEKIITNDATIVVGISGRIRTLAHTTALNQMSTNNGTFQVGDDNPFTSPTTVGIVGTLTNNGTLVVLEDTLKVGRLVQLAGSTDVEGQLIAGSSGRAHVVVAAGTLFGGGAVYGAIYGAGTIAPQYRSYDDLGLTVHGAYLPDDNGVLAVSIAAPTREYGIYSRLVIRGPARLPHNLAITTAPGFTPTLGASYKVVVDSASNLTGTVTSVSGADLGNGTHYQVTVAGKTLTLTVVADS